MSNNSTQSIQDAANLFQSLAEEQDNAIVPTNSEGLDFELVGDSAWLKVGDLSLWIRDLGDEVLIESCIDGREDIDQPDCHRFRMPTQEELDAAELDPFGYDDESGDEEE